VGFKQLFEFAFGLHDSLIEHGVFITLFSQVFHVLLRSNKLLDQEIAFFSSSLLSLLHLLHNKRLQILLLLHRHLPPTVQQSHQLLLAPLVHPLQPARLVLLPRALLPLPEVCTLLPLPVHHLRARGFFFFLGGLLYLRIVSLLLGRGRGLLSARGFFQHGEVVIYNLTFSCNYFLLSLFPFLCRGTSHVHKLLLLFLQCLKFC